MTTDTRTGPDRRMQLRRSSDDVSGVGGFHLAGHMSSLADARLIGMAPEVAGALRACANTMDAEIDEFGEWVGRGPGSKYRDARQAAADLLAKLDREGPTQGAR